MIQPIKGTVKIKCNHENCKAQYPAIKPYYYPNYEGESDAETFAGEYCDRHAHLHGFCWGCGEFCGGIESFEFSAAAHLCDSCLVGGFGQALEEFWEEDEIEL